VVCQFKDQEGECHFNRKEVALAVSEPPGRLENRECKPGEKTRERGKKGKEKGQREQKKDPRRARGPEGQLSSVGKFTAEERVPERKGKKKEKRKIQKSSRERNCHETPPPSKFPKLSNGNEGQETTK